MERQDMRRRKKEKRKKPHLFFSLLCSGTLPDGRAWIYALCIHGHAKWDHGKAGQADCGPTLPRVCGHRIDTVRPSPRDTKIPHHASSRTVGSTNPTPTAQQRPPFDATLSIW